MNCFSSILNYHGWRVPVYGTVAGLILAAFNPVVGISLAITTASLGFIAGGFWLFGCIFEMLAAWLIYDHEDGKNIPTR